MRKQIVLRLLLYITTLFCFFGCDSDPGEPPIIDPPFEPNFNIVVNGGYPFSNSSLVSIEVCVEEVDSILVWNGASSGFETGTWFANSPPCLMIPAWGIGEIEGEIPINFVFRGMSRDSEAVRDTIILDKTPPHVLPNGIYPIDGSPGVPTGLGFSWSPAEDELDPGLLHYRIMIGNKSPPQAELWSGSETQCLVPGLDKSSTYYWQIISVDSAGNEAIGPVWSFSTWDFGLPVMRLIPSGEFIMGSPESEFGRQDTEIQHSVSLSKSILMAETEVVERQFVPILQWAYDQGFVSVRNDTVFDLQSVPEVPLVYINGSRIASNYIFFSNGVFRTERPSVIMVAVSWYGAVSFCEWLNSRANFSSEINRVGDWDNPTFNPYEFNGFRLSTEAEWEYSCRAGSSEAFSNGPIGTSDCYDPVLEEIGWYCGNLRQYDFSPALKIPNDWGLYDMHGGLGNWCWDWIGPYPSSPVIDPINTPFISYRCVRGGGLDLRLFAFMCRAAHREATSPLRSNLGSVGIRFVFGFNPQ